MTPAERARWLAEELHLTEAQREIAEGVILTAVLVERGKCVLAADEVHPGCGREVLARVGALSAMSERRAAA